MKGSMHISLRAGERIYVNGAVLRFDRKVTLELLNDATFLLENHVLQAEQATSPLRQLYFVVQIMLIEPVKAADAKDLFERFHGLLRSSFENEAVRTGLDRVYQLVMAGRPFEALKTMRVLFPIEEEILASGRNPLPVPGAEWRGASEWK